MKIQRATSPPPDIILGPANTNMKNAPIIPIEEEAPWPDISACPTSLNSLFALTQAGLSTATASAIHTAYNTIPHPCLCLKIYAINYLAPLATRIDVYEEGQDWIGALMEMGANDQLIHAIVQPGMEDVMVMNTAWGWMKEAMNNRWEFYEWMIELGKVREVGRRGPKDISC
ncbi:hypothetical protein D6C99_06457 [Aureobasidium pullulans]|nr:hypothetical protein D6C99_06457 [Aureobasidium pullulans]